MKSSLVPGICGLALTAMVAVGGNHWYQVRQQVASWQATHQLPALQIPVSSPDSIPAPATAPSLDSPKLQGPSNQIAAQQSRPAPAPAPAAAPSPAPTGVASTTSAPAKEFFQGLVNQMKALQQENKDLRDQVAETNRDLMEVQFRLDTHSQEFRPLKIKNDDSIGDPTADRPISQSRERDPGVLPPRAIVPGLELPQ
ncbi:MAG: hypothetical protein QM755_24455 [Luteolibacter sp.]